MTASRGHDRRHVRSVLAHARAALPAAGTPRVAGRRTRDPTGRQPADPAPRRRPAPRPRLPGRGRAGRRRVPPGAGSDLPPLLFDDEQAVAVALALAVAPASGADIAEAAARRSPPSDRSCRSTSGTGGPRRRRHRARHDAPDPEVSGRRERSRAPPRGPALRLRRARHPAPGRAARGRRAEWPLVPARVGARARRLADLPRRPDRAADADPTPVHPASGAGRGRRRVRVGAVPGLGPRRRLAVHGFRAGAREDAARIARSCRRTPSSRRSDDGRSRVTAGRGPGTGSRERSPRPPCRSRSKGPDALRAAVAALTVGCRRRSATGVRAAHASVSRPSGSR